MIVFINFKAIAPAGAKVLETFMPSTQTAFLSVLFMAISPTIALAFGANGGSGAHVAYHTPGQIGDVILDPYGMAPLTAIIENGGYTLKDVFVRIVPKDGGQEVSYLSLIHISEPTRH